MFTHYSFPYFCITLSQKYIAVLQNLRIKWFTCNLIFTADLKLDNWVHNKFQNHNNILHDYKIILY